LSPNFNTPSSRKKGKRSVTTNATAVGMPTAKMAAPILANTIKAMCFSSYHVTVKSTTRYDFPSIGCVQL
jgi:hypothetical protein